MLAGVLSAYCRYDLARCYLLKEQTKIETPFKAEHFPALAHRCRESIGADSLVVVCAPVGAGQGEGLKVEAEEAHVWKLSFESGFGNPHLEISPALHFWTVNEFELRSARAEGNPAFCM